MQPRTSPDELHYLLAAESLIHDHDLALADNYTPEALARFHAPDWIQTAPDAYLARGNALTFPLLGMALLLAPALYGTASLLVVRVEMIVLAALLAQQVWLLLADLRVASGRWAMLGWVAAVFCPPVLLYSSQILPDLPAALLVVLALRLLLQPEPTGRQLLVAGIVAALLPWLHLRFAVLGAGLLLGVAYHALRCRRQGRARGGRWPLPLAPGLVSVAGLVVAALSTYGRPLPPTWAVGAEGTWGFATVYRYAVGALLSPGYGWLPFAPVHWLGLAGLVPLVWCHRKVVPAILLGVAAYLLVIGQPYELGANLPARYVVVLVPLIAVPLAVAVATNRTMQGAGVLLLAASLGLGGVAVTHARELYPDISGRTYLAPFAVLQELYPIVPGPTPGFKMTAAQAPHITGRLDADAGALVAEPGRDQPGHLAYGPYVSLSEGAYVARFTLAAAPDDPTRPVAILDIMQHPDTVIARREVLPSELPPQGGYAEHALPFRTEGGRGVQARVQWLGNGELRFQEVEVALLPVRNPQEQRFPYWPRALFWMTAALFIGSLLVPTGRAEERHPE